MTTADKIGLGLLGVGVAGGAGFLVYHGVSAKPQSDQAVNQPGAYANPLGPAQVQGTTGGGGVGGVLGQLSGFLGSAGSLWNTASSLFSGA